jgi:hypothetical protein
MIQNKYRSSSEGIIATYNYEDIIEGSGIANFYCCESIDSTTTQYFLTGKPLVSSDSLGVALNAGATSYDTTFTYDAAFNTTRILKGDIYAQILGQTYTQSAGDVTFTVAASVYHYDGTTETQIGSTITTQTKIGGGDATTTAWTELLVISNSSVINFKVGDIIRLKLRLVGARTGGVHIFTVFTDPAESKTKIAVPFRIDI